MYETLQKPQDVNAKATHVLARVAYIEKQQKSRAVKSKKKGVLGDPPPRKCKGWVAQNACCLLLRCFIIVLGNSMSFAFLTLSSVNSTLFFPLFVKLRRVFVICERR